MKIDVEQAAAFLKEHDHYLILMHASPDGDTLGCGTALCGALQRLGKHAKAVCPDTIPARFDYLFAAVKPEDFEPETIVCVDVADTKLLGEMKEIGDKAALCIDHHGTNKEYAERTLVKPEYAAACELVYEVINALGVPFDKALANSIYTGTATDTGCFKFSNTSPQTHLIAAEMIKHGADYAHINYVMFDMKTPGRITLEQEVLKGLRYFADKHVALVTVPLALVESITDIDNDDIGALANIPKQIAGVDIGICVKEKKPGVYKASLRSSERIDVSAIAAQFGGGGHDRAAGCSFSDCSLDRVIETVGKACEDACRKAGLI
ncbi:MAG: bifunctional oligoribonuclease/PAP phosphatase NrnA [Oscillospiraceae bacterium]